MDSEVMEIESNQVPHIFKCPTCLDCWQAGRKMLTHFLLIKPRCCKTCRMWLAERSSRNETVFSLGHLNSDLHEIIGDDANENVREGTRSDKCRVPYHAK